MYIYRPAVSLCGAQGQNFPSALLKVKADLMIHNSIHIISHLITNQRG